MSEPLPEMSREDFRTMVSLLHRYAETSLDQWDLWRLPTKFGDVFIDVRRTPTPGYDRAAYDDLARFLDSGT